jgi:hypothetical protein
MTYTHAIRVTSKISFSKVNTTKSRFYLLYETLTKPFLTYDHVVSEEVLTRLGNRI